MLRSFILVGIGGAIGSMARYACALFSSAWSNAPFPIATLAVNLLGSLVIGLLFGLAQRQQWLQSDLWLFLATGICGGFTTFSAFALDSHILIDKQHGLISLLYVATSVIFGLILCKAGIYLAGN